MSTVFLHIGQCGNQLGQAFWQEVEEASAPPHHLASGSLKKLPRSGQPARSKNPQTGLGQSHLPFSLLDGTLPCLLVDTEPKVVKRIGKVGATLTRIPSEFQLVERMGRGNNWAYGYHGYSRVASKAAAQLVRGEDLRKTVRDCVRKLVEKCDRFTGSVMFHSLAGGTGSGLGSAVLEDLREDYPLAHILSVAVAPFNCGETPLQHYNAILCLSWLQRYSDAVLLFHNDLVLHQVQRVVARGTVGQGHAARKLESISVSMETMNRYIGQTLCNTMLPVWSTRQRPVSTDVGELVRSLCADPTHKFITPTHIEYTKPGYTWDQAITHLSHPPLLRRMTKDSSVNQKPSALEVLLVARSNPSSIGQLVDGVNAVERKLKLGYSTVPWNPFPVDFWFSHEHRLKDSKRATLLANSSVVAEYLETAAQRASAMFGAKAYMHWYRRYGCEESVFEEAFETVRDTAAKYENLLAR